MDEDVERCSKLLCSPAALYSPSEVLDSIAERKMNGIYTWWFRNLPEYVPTTGNVVGGFNLMYLGIGPARPTSKQHLYGRLKNHLSPDSTKSTLRRSLGSLLSKPLSLRFVVSRVSAGNKLHFGLGEGEMRLSDWMTQNARIGWLEYRCPWDLEKRLIYSLNLPLNIEHNSHHPFYPTLRDLRDEQFRCAKKERTAASF